MTLNPIQLAEQMFGSAMVIFTGKAPAVIEFAKKEFQSIAQQIEGIATDYAAGNLTVAEAKNLLSQQINASEQRIIEVAELSELVIQQAINAALGVVSSTVNNALGFALIV